MANPALALVAEPLDRKALESQIGVALGAASTHVFLDTSALIWMYRLHEAARKEVAYWLENGPQSGSVHIPRRAIHEFSRHRRNSGTLIPFNQNLSSLTNLLNQLEQWAHLIIDDDRVKGFGFGSRTAYLAEVAALAKSADRLVKPITKTYSLDSLDAELIPLFNRLALNIDIYSNMTELQRTFNARLEARMPPGFMDAGKARQASAGESHGKDEDEVSPDLAGTNRFGDFVIWEEIIQFCTGRAGLEDVVILTHDRKRDWSYTPQMIIDHDGHTKPNLKGQFRVTVAHPLLAHEIQLRANVPKLHIITMPQLAWLDSHLNLDLSLAELSRAVQVEGQAEMAAAAGIVQENQQALEAEPAAEIVEAAQATSLAPEADFAVFSANPPAEALADALYNRDPDGAEEMDRVIKQLKSSNWYTQNLAAEKGVEQLRSSNVSLLQAFVFGRNIYQAACGAASTPIMILEDLPEQLRGATDSISNAVYAGALFEAYFNKNGEVRPRPKGQQITALLAGQDHPLFGAAVDLVRGRLVGLENRYLVLPAAQRITLKIECDADSADRIMRLRVGDFALSEPQNEGADAGRLSQGTTYERMRNIISRHFAIPENQFVLLPSYDGIREIASLQLIEWGPGTEVRFPAG